MREYKFRAWDRTQFPARMIEWEQLKQSPCYAVFINCIEVDIMQYTGLKDIDGREIFEGDIVENPVYENNEGRLTNVGVDYFEIKWSPDECVLYGDNIGSKTGHLSLIDLYECKIIGNIYENQELLAEAIK